jgi:predicted RNA-binding protein with PIN domain
MPKIHDIVLTRPLEAVLVEAVDAIPDAAAVQLGQQFPGGYREAKMIRGRLREMLQSPGPVPPWLLVALQSALPACASVMALSSQALRDQFDLLAAAAGPARFLVALVADDRPAVRKLAQDNLATATTVMAPAAMEAAREKCVQEFQAAFAPFLEGRTGSPPPGKAGESAASGLAAKKLAETVEEQKRTLSDLRRKLEKERKAHEEHRRQVEEEAQAEAARVSAEIGRLNARVQELAGQKEALQAQQANAERTLQQAITAGVHEQLAAIERGFLREAVAVEETVQHGAGATLLERVEELLRAQAALDRHSGNRAELNGRLEQLAGAKLRVQHAVQNALLLVPGLRETEQDLDNEIRHLSSRLRLPPAEDGHANRILSLIGECEDFSGLRDCSDLVQTLSQHQLFPSDKTKEFYRAIHRKHTILTARSKPAESGSHFSWLGLPVRLQHREDSLLILDGYNILFAIDQLRQLFEDRKPNKAARRQLIDLTRHFLVNRPKIEGLIVFDGPRFDVHQEAPNLKIEFSGGEGEHRADNRIFSLVQSNALSNPGRAAFVVTDDRGIWRRIHSQNATGVPVGAFEMMLQNFPPLDPSALNPILRP